MDEEVDVDRPSGALLHDLQLGAQRLGGQHGGGDRAQAAGLRDGDGHRRRARPRHRRLDDGMVDAEQVEQTTVGPLHRRSSSGHRRVLAMLGFGLRSAESAMMHGSITVFTVKDVAGRASPITATSSASTSPSSTASPPTMSACARARSSLHLVAASQTPRQPGHGAGQHLRRRCRCLACRPGQARRQGAQGTAGLRLRPARLRRCRLGRQHDLLRHGIEEGS